MSWLLNLYQTYESNLDLVGKVERKRNDQEYMLLPICHTTQNAHIVVNVTEDGEFHSAFVAGSDDMNTVIPATESSASRAGTVNAPYPLHDKLSYVAGDYNVYGGNSKKRDHYAKYKKQLEAWASSVHAAPKVRSIYHYLRQGRLIHDLIEHRILFVDDDQRLIEKWDKKYEHLSAVKPEIFGAVAGQQEDAFVRFNVYSPERLLTDVWKDQEMYDSFIRFYSGQLGEEDFCYVTGQLQPATDRHANKIRHSADKAKLISANDSTGFTFRGRFQSSDEAASISYDVSQKAHNALKWLINRQAKVEDQRVFLVWSNDVTELPHPTDDFYSLDSTAASSKTQIVNTNREFAREVAKAMDGYRNHLSHPDVKDTKVNILVLDSATTGRMAVLYYRNMDKDLYLDRLVKWHSTCAWLHRYRKNAEGEFVQFYGAPATRDIALAAYGSRADGKIVKGLMERMLSCIIDDREQRIPQDIVASVFHRASNPVSMDNWEWEKTLSIACALINKREGTQLALDTESDNRDYLFGRLLAVADVLERRALGSEEKRATNAIRYMNAFSKHPARTWLTIQQCLQPYQARLGRDATYWSKIIDEIGSRIPIEQFNNNPLSGVYLLGFYSQRHELYQKKDKDTELEERSR